MVVSLFAISGGILLYPTASAAWNGFVAGQRITAYEEAASEMEQNRRERILEDARAYNRQHLFNTIADAFDGDGSYIRTHPYDSLLDPGGDGVMGYLEIPKIQQDLVIFHGTGTTALERGVGHVEGTSLPVGGESTHAVLAGHRGLQQARLFTDLDLLAEGDKFFLHVLGDVYAYEIDRISVVLPEETQLLDIADGEDLVTLVTCTPYGINTHRLLVRGYRIPYSEKEHAEETAKARPLDLMDISLAALLAGITAMLVIWIYMRRRTEQGEHGGKR
ncbi:MAG: class C sortase [Lachnospiraceae bacterium]|nr:class C sortase [Sarcina sp.]MBR2728893.1 class C sortase [Lachnospiraceae bacterium]